MQAEALLWPACIDRGLKWHEKTGSALNVSAQNNPQIIHKMKGEIKNGIWIYDIRHAATALYAIPKSTGTNLPNAHSLTCRMFTESEGGEQHCQIGNHLIAINYIIDWLDQYIRKEPWKSKPPYAAVCLLESGGNRDNMLTRRFGFVLPCGE